MNKTTWVVVWSATGLVASESAMACDSLLTIVRSCATRADDVARLKCYDQAVAGFSAAADGDSRCTNVAAPGAPVNATSSPIQPQTPPVELNSVEQFGLTAGQVLRKESTGKFPAAQQLTAHIVTMSPGRGGRLVVRLDNNQVWEQTENGPDLLMAVGDTVTIDRGVLGAYWLSAHSRHAQIKVRRTQ
jgi:hypothetical protein